MPFMPCFSLLELPTILAGLACLRPVRNPNGTLVILCRRGPPAPLPKLADAMRDRANANITTRGERGDRRDLKPNSFTLDCPHCGCPKEAAHITLFSTRARGITCAKCCRNTSSTRWLCCNSTPWQQCTGRGGSDVARGLLGLVGRPFITPPPSALHTFNSLESAGSRKWAPWDKALIHTVFAIPTAGTQKEVLLLSPGPIQTCSQTKKVKMIRMVWGSSPSKWGVHERLSMLACSWGPEQTKILGLLGKIWTSGVIQI